MEVWKEFEQNPITHSVAHHLVAIAELLEAYGYARVSDVARLLEITRGSVSVTLKGLKQRGLVTEDERRFIGLSGQGRAIAQSIQAKKRVMKKLFVEVLGVAEEQADIDTCKIEHLVSGPTTIAATRLLRFLNSGDADVDKFLQSFAKFEQACEGKPTECPCCEDVCLITQLDEFAEGVRQKKGDS